MLFLFPSVPMALSVSTTYKAYNLSPQCYSNGVRETTVTPDAANWYGLPAEKRPVWEKYGPMIMGDYWGPILAIFPA